MEKRRRRVTSEAEIRVIWPQAKKATVCQQPPEAGRGRIFPQSLQKKGGLSTPLFQISRLQNFKRIHIYCFKLPILWYFVTAIPEN